MWQTKSGLTKHIKLNNQQNGCKYKSIDKDFLFFSK